MSQRELAERMGYPSNKLNQLIKGEVSLTRDTAGKLEKVLGIPARTWLNLEARYQEEKLAIEEMERLESGAEWLKGFPLKKMEDLGLLSAGTIAHRVGELLTFFRVASPREWRRIYVDEEVSVAFKISLAKAPDPKPISVWLRYGELQARELKLNEYSADAFKQALDVSKELAYRQPADFLNKLQRLCSQAGVALVYTPSFSKSMVSGATRWINGRQTPLIQLSDRYRSADHFWFSFYHEALHVLKHGKTAVFLEGVKGLDQPDKQEKEANNFALRMVLNGFPLHQFVGGHGKHWSEREVVTHARKYQIHPGTLVAQLQRIGRLAKNNLNGLKVKISF
jgi:transcriptional regulator with XRE-family HTH domain